VEYDNSLTSLSVTLYEFRNNEETTINVYIRKIRRTTYKTDVDKKTDGEKGMVDRKMNEQKCDNKTQARTELEWHGDNDHWVWDVIEAFTYGPPTATSSCVQYLLHIQHPFNSLSFINMHPWLSFRNLITPLYLRPFGFPTEPISEQTSSLTAYSNWPENPRSALYSWMLTCVCIPPLFWFGSENLLKVTNLSPSTR
jgi:hypothetical protein